MKGWKDFEVIINGQQYGIYNRETAGQAKQAALASLRARYGVAAMSRVDSVEVKAVPYLRVVK